MDERKEGLRGTEVQSSGGIEPGSEPGIDGEGGG